jgi:hypothetical protein
MTTAETLSARYADITCPHCRANLIQCPTNENGWRDARAVFEVGNMARGDMGHAMYFTTSGRTALCVAVARKS